MNLATRQRGVGLERVEQHSFPTAVAKTEPVSAECQIVLGVSDRRSQFESDSSRTANLLGNPEQIARRLRLQLTDSEIARDA